jgi:hypothetical protein
VTQIAGALVANYSGIWQLFCAQCWTESRVSRHGSLADEVQREKAARHFVKLGWAWIDGPRCPSCAKTVKEQEAWQQLRDEALGIAEEQLP